MERVLDIYERDYMPEMILTHILPLDPSDRDLANVLTAVESIITYPVIGGFATVPFSLLLTRGITKYFKFGKWSRRGMYFASTYAFATFGSRMGRRHAFKESFESIEGIDSSTVRWVARDAFRKYETGELKMGDREAYFRALKKYSTMEWTEWKR
jgi:hypothetical protein